MNENHREPNPEIEVLETVINHLYQGALINKEQGEELLKNLYKLESLIPRRKAVKNSKK